MRKNSSSLLAKLTAWLSIPLLASLVVADLMNTTWFSGIPFTFASKRAWVLIVLVAILIFGWLFGLVYLISGRTPAWVKNVQTVLPRFLQVRWTTLLISAYLLVALAALIPQVLLVFRGETFIASVLTIDDTYYYLQTAWNTAHLGMVSFDGINPTNGVQLLWFFILVVLAFLIQVKAHYLVGALLLAILMNCACFYPIWKIGSQIADLRFSFILAVLWLFTLLNSTIYLSGMENSLHALVLWTTLWVFLITIHKIDTQASLSLAPFSLCLCLLVFTRLDSVVYAGVIFLAVLGYILYKVKPKINRAFFRPLLIPGGIILLSVVVMFASFKLMGGSWLPVSSYIKISASQQVSLAQALMDYFKLGVPDIIHFNNNEILPYFFLAALVIFVTASLVSKPKPIILLTYICLAGYFIYALVIFIIDINYSPYSWWYRSPIYITHLLILAYALIQLSDWIIKWVNRRMINVIVFIFFLTHSIFMGFQSSTQNVDKGTIYFKRYQASIWLMQNLPQGVVLSSYNAGQFGFFSGHPVVNLDGLINSYDFYKTVLSAADSSLATAQYLRNTGVDYFVDYLPHGLEQYFTQVKVLDKRGMNGQPIILYQVR